MPISTSPLMVGVHGNQDLSGIAESNFQDKDSIKEQELKLKFSEDTHQYVREYIRLADQKATFFFAGGTTLLAYLNGDGFVNRWLTSPKDWDLIGVISFFATIGLIGSILACLWTVIPRLNGSKRGNIFFFAIREHESSQAYADQLKKLSIAELCEEKQKHIYDLSGVCRSKYNVLRWGQWLGALGVLATLVLIVSK